MKSALRMAVVLLLGAAAATSCLDGSDELGETNAGSGGSAASGSGGSYTGGSSGGPTAGSGGAVFEAGVNGGTGGGGGFGASCASFKAEATRKALPSDIIITVDQSGSMNKETKWVQEQLNGFSKQIMDANIDVHVVLIAEKPGGPVGKNPICVPPPLASRFCADNPPVFTHISERVGSKDALSIALNQYSAYQHALREEAHKHIIVISDDNSSMTGSSFDDGIRATPKIKDYTFHAIVCTQKCEDAAQVGSVYVGLVSKTRGVIGNLCDQNFAPVWDAVSTQVIEHANLDCAWEIPEPPKGETLNPDKVNVVYTSAGVEKQLGRVDSARECGQSTDSWYYDSPTAPTTVMACPALCNQIKKDQEAQINAQEAQIDIVFGCDSIIVVPK